MLIIELNFKIDEIDLKTLCINNHLIEIDWSNQKKKMTSGLAATVQHLEDPDKLETLHQMSKYINEMPEEV